MIRYALICEAGHRFEAWFASAAGFDAQAERGLLSCAACGSTAVSKALMTPGLRTSKARAETQTQTSEAAGTETADRGAAPAPAKTPDGVKAPDRPRRPAPPMPQAPDAMMRAAVMRHVMRKVRAHVVATAEDVGENFAKEARAVHEGEAPERGIYGRATREEVEDLLDDGIEIAPLPDVPETDA